MKEALVDPNTNVRIIESPIPQPGHNEVLIKVIASDWKVPVASRVEANTGDDIAGTIYAVGPGVLGLHQGDRVAAFHIMMTPHGSFAEYAIAPQHTVLPIPEFITFEEAATVPLAAYTACVALFHELEIPSPWDLAAKQAAKDGANRPLVIYGGSTAIGAFAIKLARWAGIHPLIVVGSKNSDFILPFLDHARGDRMIDYTTYTTENDLVDAIRGAMKAVGIESGRVFDVFDCVSEPQTISMLTRLVPWPLPELGRKPRVTIVVPGLEHFKAEPAVDVSVTMVGLVFEKGEGELFGLVWGRVLSQGLMEGWLSPHPYNLVDEGLQGLQGALQSLRHSLVRGKKMVIRLADTVDVVCCG